MATGPIPPPSAVSSFQATRSKIGPLFAVGGVAVAGWMMRQSYKGNRHLWEEKAADHHTKMEYEYLQMGWGHDSGHPFLDHLEHKLKGLKMFGPNGIFAQYHHNHAISSGFWKDVVQENLFAILLAITSIYVGFGPGKIHGAIGHGFRRLPFFNRGARNNPTGLPPASPPPVPAAPSLPPLPNQDTYINSSQPLQRSSRNIGGKVFRGITAPFRKGRAPFTLIALGLGLFILHQFRRIWNHSAQQDRFRGWINGTEH